MQTGNNRNPGVSLRSARGRAVIIGIAQDDPAGHVRLTRCDGFRLVGGSQPEHTAMFIQAQRIREELAKRGLSLKNITREQADEISEIIASINFADK